MAKRTKQKPKAAPITFETVRQLALTFPGATEGTSYGTPAFKVRGKLFLRFHECGDSIVVKIDPSDRAMRMNAGAATFYITDHYAAYPLMLMRFSSVDTDDLRNLLEESWRRCAPKRLVADYDAQKCDVSDCNH